MSTRYRQIGLAGGLRTWAHHALLAEQVKPCQRPCSTSSSAAPGEAMITEGTARRCGHPDRLGKTRSRRRAVHSPFTIISRICEAHEWGSVMTVNHDALPATAAPTHSGVSTIIRRLTGVAKIFKTRPRPRCRSRSGGGAPCSATFRCRSAPLTAGITGASARARRRAVGVAKRVPQARRRGQHEAQGMSRQSARTNMFGHNVIDANKGSCGDCPRPGRGDHLAGARGDPTARAQTTDHRQAATRGRGHRSTAAAGPDGCR